MKLKLEKILKRSMLNWNFQSDNRNPQPFTVYFNKPI